MTYHFSYDTLPKGWRVADLDDFHSLGRKHVGMKYILHGWHFNKFELYTLNESMTAAELKQWIDYGRCYVQEG